MSIIEIFNMHIVLLILFRLIFGSRAATNNTINYLIFLCILYILVYLW